MMRLRKFITLLNYTMKRYLKILGFLILIFILAFGCKRQKEPEQLKQEVITNEALFKSLVDYFTSVLLDSNYIVTFGVDKPNSVNLSYYKNQGNLADPKNQSGGEHLNFHSPELDKLLKELGWTYETVNKLTAKLNAIHFDYIRNTDRFCKPINIYNTPGGFVNTDYNIYPVEKLAALKGKIRGSPVGATDFLKRVYIITTSAL